MEERSRLHVEGADDRHVVRHLLRRHGLLDHASEGALLQIRDVGGRRALLDGIRPAVFTGTDRSVGFIIDTDSSIENTWAAVSNRLREVAVDVPNEIPRDGFVGTSTAYRTRVGVWLMPDNRRDGSLESFLAELARATTPRILQHAEAATGEAIALGAEVPATAIAKAVLHAWLAWQPTPGLPYGSAIGAHFFTHDTTTAARFIAWFRRLFAFPNP